MGSEQEDTYVSNGAIPTEIIENFTELFPEDDEFSFLEIVQAQKGVYDSLRMNHDCKTESLQGLQSPECQKIKSEIALDEEIARSLELGEPFDNLCISEAETTFSAESSSRGGSSSESSEISLTPIYQDTTDLDQMSYEELLELRETVGTESKGLGEEFIARLSNSKHHQVLLFSKKKRVEKCVICYMPYKITDKLNTLPCMHCYHSKCITRWLRQSKICPICNKEVDTSEL